MQTNAVNAAITAEERKIIYAHRQMLQDKADRAEENRRNREWRKTERVRIEREAREAEIRKKREFDARMAAFPAIAAAVDAEAAPLRTAIAEQAAIIKAATAARDRLTDELANIIATKKSSLCPYAPHCDKEFNKMRADAPDGFDRCGSCALFIQ